MTDKKLTDSEIVKALRSWLEEIRKSRQAYLEKVNEEHYPSMRYEYLLSDTIHEINRLQAENERLKKSNRNWRRKVQRLRKPLPASAVSMMVEQAEHQKQKAEEFIANLKAEAHKECIEKVKESSNKTELVCSGALVQTDYTITEEKLDNILKELVGDEI